MNKNSIVNERFFAIVQELGDRPALAFLTGAGWERWSYGRLAERSLQIASQLTALGVRPGDAVGIIASRHPDTIAALIAILEVDAHYLPLDSAYPAARLKMLCEDASLRIVVSALPIADPGRIPVPLHVLDDALSTANRIGPSVASTPESPAYVMFTSGSTGVPKGVVVPHRAIVRLVDKPNFMRLDESRVFLHLSPLAFDASTLEIWGPLLNGGLCVLYPDQQIPTAKGLAAVIRETGVNSAWLTASLFNSVIDQDAGSLEGLEELLVGGEALSVPHVRKAMARLPRTQIINGYGPTENTTFTTCYRIPVDFSDTERRVPIGFPISGTQVAIVGPDLEPVADGMEGELVALGDGLALGYLNRPELTRERFVDVRGPEGASRRGYRTGDRVVALAGGLIDYLGRFDDQVKIDGHRIEPGEIERVIMTLPGIRDCRVLVRTGPAGQKRLAAYVVAEDGSLQRHGLRNALAESLPAYMVPHYFFFLDVLPTNANGKLDKDVLPDPFKAGGLAGTEGGSPERVVVARAWEKMLGRVPPSDDVNFFDAGGTSLEAVELGEAIGKQLSRELPPTFVFEYSTINKQVEALGATTRGDAGVPGRGQQRRSAAARRAKGGVFHE